MHSTDLPLNTTLRRSDLHARGLSDFHITRLVREGVLARPRKGIYLRGDSVPDVVDAARVGGRLACLGVLARRGVFVHSRPEHVHVHVPPHTARLRTTVPARVHWKPLSRTPHPAAVCVDVIDALEQSAFCQPPRAFIASVDSALNLGELHPDDVDALFARLPRRLRRLRGLVDGRAESGTETYVRLMLRSLGARVELQVRFRGIGRVDLLVDAWLVVECDSRAHHATWEQQRADRRRDQALAARGFAVYRPIAEDILHRPELVVAALKGLRSIAGPRTRAWEYSG
jgi:very-short-patch-repair endonuclease